jgi:hypothetical protein
MPKMDIYLEYVKLKDWYETNNIIMLRDYFHTFEENPTEYNNFLIFLLGNELDFFNDLYSLNLLDVSLSDNYLIQNIFKGMEKNNKVLLSINNKGDKNLLSDRMKSELKFFVGHSEKLDEIFKILINDEKVIKEIIDSNQTEFYDYLPQPLNDLLF